MSVMKIDDYAATVEFDESAAMFHGRIVNIRDVVDFYSDAVEGLGKEFEASLAVYLESRGQQGIEPAKPLSGQFVLRLGPELHARVAVSASAKFTSMNAWIFDAIKKKGVHTD